MWRFSCIVQVGFNIIKCVLKRGKQKETILQKGKNKEMSSSGERFEAVMLLPLKLEEVATSQGMQGLQLQQLKRQVKGLTASRAPTGILALLIPRFKPIETGFGLLASNPLRFVFLSHQC